MTPAEIIAFNAGVLAVLKIAQDAAEAITRTSKRHVHEEFAVTALAELAEAGRALLLPLDHDPPAPMGSPASAASDTNRSEKAQ